jgi:hypothetical protein
VRERGGKESESVREREERGKRERDIPIRERDGDGEGEREREERGKRERDKPIRERYGEGERDGDREGERERERRRGRVISMSHERRSLTNHAISFFRSVRQFCHYSYEPRLRIDCKEMVGIVVINRLKRDRNPVETS